MKKLAVILLIALIGIGSAQAQMFQTVTPEEATLLQSGPGKTYCPNCGMHLVKFYKTSHAMHQADGAQHQYCSLHCLVEANTGDLDKAQVVDTASLKFISAKDAFYVVGSSVKGTMTMKSKYAFADKKAAEAFMKENGGELMDFAAATKIARTALAMENKNIDKKRAMMAGKGEKVFAKMCQKEDLPHFHSIAEAKTYIAENGTCGELDDGQMQAVAIYLFNRDHAHHHAAKALVVPKKSKCPVCGMFVDLYPKWAALIETTDGQTLYFDGVKDLMKFYLQPEKFKEGMKQGDFKTIQVTDYYTLQAFAADQAWYVLDSNVFGPMGNELIPFQTRKDAETFKKDHFGIRIVSFSEITRKMVYDLDK